MPFWLKACALSGFLMTLLFVALSIVPIVQVESRLLFAAKITALIVAANTVGLALFRTGRATEEFVRMIVADTGDGMSPAAQSKLFEPFLAGDDAGERAIGLAKVDAIVRQAGGRIHVQSAPGAGTTFTIDLPATSESAAAPEPLVADTQLPLPVLVVEDEPRVRELIRLVLVRAGHEVVAVAGPRAALAALNRQPAVSLMLVDLIMPEMDGYDLVVEARAIAPRVRVVFMSGFAPDHARHPSGDGFLAKPFTVESLTSVVKAALAAA